MRTAWTLPRRRNDAELHVADVRARKPRAREVERAAGLDRWRVAIAGEVDRRRDEAADRALADERIESGERQVVERDRAAEALCEPRLAAAHGRHVGDRRGEAAADIAIRRDDSAESAVLLRRFARIFRRRPEPLLRPTGAALVVVVAIDARDDVRVVLADDVHSFFACARIANEASQSAGARF